MILPDVNVLVHAHDVDGETYDDYRSWWESVVNSSAPFGMADLVLSGFIRITTHPKILGKPLSPTAALDAIARLRERPNYVPVHPGERHWSLFEHLCRRTSARGNHVPDAFLAALAIESGSEFVTADRGFARYPGLSWRHPLD